MERYAGSAALHRRGSCAALGALNRGWHAKSVMAKNLADLRFAIRSSIGHVSSVWRLWVTRHGDVYLATRGMAKIEKYSFHKSGICRSSFTKEYGTPTTLTDRAMFKWKRLATPADGEGRASRVAWLGFPTDYLSRQFKSSTEEVVWIEAAPAGGATYVEIAYTFESEESVRKALDEGQERNLVTYVELPGDEALFVDYYHSDWDNKDLKMPGNGEVADLVFSPRDPNNTGRPIRIRLGPAPSDGNALVLQELGGYAVPLTPNTAVERNTPKAARP